MKTTYFITTFSEKRGHVYRMNAEYETMKEAKADISRYSWEEKLGYVHNKRTRQVVAVFDYKTEKWHKPTAANLYGWGGRVWENVITFADGDEGREMVYGGRISAVLPDGRLIIVTSLDERHPLRRTYWTRQPDEVEHNRYLDVPEWAEVGCKIRRKGEADVLRVEGFKLITIDVNVDAWDVVVTSMTYGSKFRTWLNIDAFEPVADEEPTLEGVGEIKAVCIEGVILTAEKRQKWVKNFGDIIREHTTMGKETQYNHDCGCICVNVAYRNDSNDPDDMTYCVAWYKWLDIVTEKRELVECENGVRLEQAARAMADFHLLADAGLSLRQILYPAA